MEDGDVAAPRLGIRERPDVAAQLVVDREREQIRRVPGRAEHAAHAPRAVADGVPLVRRRDPLVEIMAGIGPGSGSVRRSDRRHPAIPDPGSIGSAR